MLADPGLGLRPEAEERPVVDQPEERQALFPVQSLEGLFAEFEARAQDEIGPLTLLSTKTGGLVCPYDGGIDIFLEDPLLVPSMRSQFRAWLSTHPSGL